jgi:prepilin-type N-terminal cleavage/methylation domain-containing protein
VSRRAFTLPEMMLAVALMAVLATVAAVSLAGAKRAARMQDVVEQVTAYDRGAREWSRRFDRPTTLAIDLGAGTISQGRTDDSSRAPLRLPTGFHIQTVRDAENQMTAGQTRIACSPLGQSRSYAILLEGPAHQQQWVLFVGLTGQTLALHDVQEVQDIFLSLGGGDDAG